ncbi:hypothetical protein chiPu_0022836 [Chiloscyllium punctatum]|uniref:Uncharacterized protein n=1 Tax=Chiloscyllium punctatum TaxID=137246 RepID=A0A401T9A0_CHIPU|nr:hypothetical protein [Chiloscyllium punctatum]
MHRTGWLVGLIFETKRGTCKYMAYLKNRRLAATVNVFSIQKPVETLCNPRRGRSRDIPFRARKTARQSRDVSFRAPEAGRGGHVMLRFVGKSPTWGRTSGNARRRGMESDQQPIRR